MKPVVVGVVVALALLVAGYLFFVSPPAVIQTPTEEVGMNLYANGTYGLSFSYPENYVLTEEMIGEGLFVITLIHEENTELPVNGEGPTAITVEISGHAPGFTLADWLSSPASNFQLSNGTSDATTVSGAEAVHYSWSGLYEGGTTAFLHEGNIFTVSVSYHSLSDPIRTVYANLLASLTLR